MADYWLIALKNSLILVGGSCLVALLVALFTSVCAWRSGHAMGRLLPLVILGVPPYLLVFCLSETVEYLDPWLPAIGVLGLCNSAFIHAPLTSYLSRQGEALFEAAYVASGSRCWAMFHTLMPALRAALPMGLTIVACEALSDLAVSRYYGIQSIVVMTFNAWTSGLALPRIVPGLCLMIISGSLLSLIGKRTKDLPSSARELKKKGIYAVFACLPACVVLVFCIGTFAQWLSRAATPDYQAIWEALKNSMLLLNFALAGCALAALYMARFGSKLFMVRICLFLYAIPGLVLAAMMLPLGRWLPYFIMLNCAIFMRFSCLMVVNMDAIMQAQRALHEMLRASCSDAHLFKQKVVLCSPAIVTGLCLVALDVLRELPMSRLLQPLNFTTLAMRISYLSATEMLSSMAVEAIILFTVGIMLTLIMIRVQYAFSR